jgi:hypothetical protein
MWHQNQAGVGMHSSNPSVCHWNSYPKESSYQHQISRITKERPQSGSQIGDNRQVINRRQITE